MEFPWTYSIVRLPVQALPATHAVFLECRDDLGYYRGIEIGRQFESEEQAQAAIDSDRSTRTDRRTATELSDDDFRYAQEVLDAHNAEYEAWRGMTDAQKDEAIKGAV